MAQRLDAMLENNVNIFFYYLLTFTGHLLFAELLLFRLIIYLVLTKNNNRHKKP